jgi:hypothetical protein
LAADGAGLVPVRLGEPAVGVERGADLEAEAGEVLGRAAVLVHGQGKAGGEEVDRLGRRLVPAAEVLSFDVEGGPGLGSELHVPLRGPAVDRDGPVGAEAELLGGGGAVGVFRVGQDVERCRQGMLVDPFDQRGQVAADADPEEVAGAPELATEGRGKLDRVVEVLDGGEGLEVGAESLTVDNDPGEAAKQGGIIVIDLVRVSVVIDRGIEDGGTAGDLVHPIRRREVLDQEHHVALGSIPRVQHGRGDGGENLVMEVFADPFP